ncbi:hypothetical protein D917_07638 [Trichinella nativa]|uniref:Uncharacterized protein n=1 Tax=Trichinella nativa TaxID=6335 RepID=A0A1Y3EN33_9BILA|nr:hypothetical protein D917_07638 [Trichinella nativa]
MSNLHAPQYGHIPVPKHEKPVGTAGLHLFHNDKPAPLTKGSHCLSNTILLLVLRLNAESSNRKNKKKLVDKLKSEKSTTLRNMLCLFAKQTFQKVMQEKNHKQQRFKLHRKTDDDL